MFSILGSCFASNVFRRLSSSEKNSQLQPFIINAFYIKGTFQQSFNHLMICCYDAELGVGCCVLWVLCTPVFMGPVQTRAHLVGCGCGLWMRIVGANASVAITVAVAVAVAYVIFEPDSLVVRLFCHHHSLILLVPLLFIFVLAFDFIALFLSLLVLLSQSLSCTLYVLN